MLEDSRTLAQYLFPALCAVAVRNLTIYRFRMNVTLFVPSFINFDSRIVHPRIRLRYRNRDANERVSRADIPLRLGIVVLLFFLRYVNNQRGSWSFPLEQQR
jgi:hypothetical protein